MIKRTCFGRTQSPCCFNKNRIIRSFLKLCRDVRPTNAAGDIDDHPKKNPSDFTYLLTVRPLTSPSSESPSPKKPKLKHASGSFFVDDCFFCDQDQMLQYFSRDDENVHVLLSVVIVVTSFHRCETSGDNVEDAAAQAIVYLRLTILSCFVMFVHDLPSTSTSKTCFRQCPLLDVANIVRCTQKAIMFISCLDAVSWSQRTCKNQNSPCVSCVP